MQFVTPLGTSYNFLHVRTYWRLGAIFYAFIFFFFWCWSKLFLLLSVEWFSSVTSASDTTQLPKTGHGRKANWQENSHVTLKIKTKIEILALSLLLVFQQCYCSSGLHATRWSRQCIFNLINNLMFQVPSAEWKWLRLLVSFLNEHLSSAFLNLLSLYCLDANINNPFSGASS